MITVLSTLAARFAADVKKYKILYLMLLPGLAWYIIYRYLPMAGVMIAFKKYSFSQGIFGSPWIGLKNFQMLFQMRDFFLIVRNTVVISLYNLVFGFPFPVLIALLLNELYSKLFKRVIQTVIYLPHFLSWVVFGGIIIQLLSPNNGMISNLIRALGGEPVFFMARSEYFRGIIVITDIIKEAGWGAIIYLAALAGIDMEQYEAAIIDGAGRFQKLVHITLPGIANTIIIMLILRVGKILDVGFDQVYILSTPSVYDVGDVISTYIYRIGIVNMQFGLTTAIGLFQSAIGAALIIATNAIARKYSDVSMW
jgi:putative aldouronate transport system permease protein